MGYDEFFTDGDKPYAENLNDSLLLMDAFNVTVPCKLPTMYSNGEFSSTTNVKRKAGIAIVTLKSVASGVTVGTTSISGSGEVVFRIYPNFNSFYKWYSIVLEKTGSVNIAFKKTDGTSISASVGNDGVISETSALKELQEIDVVLTLSSATISSILVNFVNNQSSRVRTGALLEASQLTNVNGTVTSGNGAAVSGGTVYTAMTAKEDLSNKVTTLDSSSSHYPSCSAVKAVTDSLGSTKENVNNKVSSLINSNVHYPTAGAVKIVTDSKADKEWTTISTSVGKLEVNASLRLASFTFTKLVNLVQNEQYVYSVTELIPSGYRPAHTVSQLCPLSIVGVLATISEYGGFTLYSFENIPIPRSGSAYLDVHMIWKY